jgi:hypothetical protein
MATVIFKMKGCISLGSIATEQDLQLGNGFYINPPPQDGRCYCCGRHISELEPFEKDEDDFVFDLDGEYLVKAWRPAGPYDEGAEQAVREAEQRFSEEGFDGPLEWLIDVYGEGKGKSLMYAAEAFGTSCADWLCRDCIVLDEDEYFEKLRQRSAQESENCIGA